jgi:cytochrome c553
MAVSEALLALCMACHGPQGNTQVATTPSLAAQPRLFLENQLVLIREGMREVPTMKGMLAGVNDADISALAQYFAAQKAAPPPDAGPVRDASVRRGREIAGRMLCGSCHLPDYRGREQIPRLALEPEAFLKDSMRQFRDRPGPGRDTIMAASLRGLKDEDLDDLAHYFANFRP